MTDMTLSAAGAAFIRHSEGFVDHWYLDPVKVPTIGIGFTWASVAFRDWWGKNKVMLAFVKGATMTRAEADAVLVLVVAGEYGAAVNKFLGSQKAPQHVFDAMCSVVYNLGPGSLKWKWAAAIKAGKLAEAGTLLRTTGTTAKGVKLKGLVTRRREEAELLVFGDYSVGKVYAEPIEIPSSANVLSKGARGDVVRELQMELTGAGYYKGAIDGIFGVGTEAAVLAFQRARGLDDDGKVGLQTWDALGRDDFDAKQNVENLIAAASVPTKAEVQATHAAITRQDARNAETQPLKGPINDFFKGILAKWMLRRVLEVGGVTTAIWTIVSQLSPLQQQAILDLVGGKFDQVSVGVVVGIALYLGTQVWSLVSTIRPQVVADGKQMTTTNDAASVAKATAQTVEAKSILEK